MAGFHADARRALGRRPRPSRCSTWAAARACSPSSGPSGWATGASWASTSTTPSCAPSGRSAGARTSSSAPRRPPRCRSPTTSSTWPPRSRCSSTCPSPRPRVAEMARVARAHLLVSVPREPLWRGLNMARGAYLRDLGNTPGHVNHWSKRAFVSLLSRYGTVEEVRSPFPWTMLLVRVGEPCPPKAAASQVAATAGARPILSVGIGITGLVTFALLLARQPRAAGGRVRRHRAAVVGDLHHRLGALPAGRAAAVAHDRRPRRARRSRAASTCAWRPRSSSALGLAVRGRRAGAARADPGRPLRRLGDALLDPDRGRAGLRGELLRARLPGRPPPVRPLRRARADGVDLALPVRARRDRRRSPRARRRWRSAWRRRRSSRSAWCRRR